LTCGEQNNRNAFRLLVVFQGREHFETIELGHVDIENDKIRPGPGHGFYNVASVGHGFAVHAVVC